MALFTEVVLPYHRNPANGMMREMKRTVVWTATTASRVDIGENCRIEDGGIYAGHGTTYVSDTGLTTETNLTNAPHFTVREIVVLESRIPKSFYL
jgi:hypothetical protein